MNPLSSINLNTLKGKWLCAVCLLFFACSLSQLAKAQTPAGGTFTNPLLDGGADPWVIYHNGYYYYTHTTGGRLVLWKTKNLANLRTAEKKVVWTPPKNEMYSKAIWAPELHYLNNKWYIYFAADDGDNQNHRMYVVENTAKDPMRGDWTFMGQVAPKGDEDKWAIDATLFTNKGQLYMVWSGWEVAGVNRQQNIYIAKMKNPYTVDGARVMISSPDRAWEKFGAQPNNKQVLVNEGPEILMHGDKIFMVYSGNGCWTDHYLLGMCVASVNDDLMNAASWKKIDKPQFQTSERNNVWAPGHNSFFKSPDGTEDWILYHANPAPHCGCGGQRTPRMQKFTWNEDGTPNFGEPVAPGQSLPLPAGTDVKGK